MDYRTDELIKLVHKFISSNLKYRNFFDSEEDMFSELLTQVVYAYPIYNGDKGTLATYLYAVCKNYCLRKITDAYRQKNNGSTVSLDTPIFKSEEDGDVLLGDTLSTDEDIEEDLSEKLLVESLKKYLDEYSTMYFIDGLNFRQIAKIKGCSHEWVRLCIKKNIRRIQGMIKNGIDICQKETISKEERIQQIMSSRNCSRRQAYRIYNREQAWNES